MKKKLIAAVFCVLGIALALGTVVLSLGMRDASPVMLSEAKGVEECTRMLMDRVCQGDYSGASTVLLGNPNLGADRDAKDAVGQLLWDAFTDSMKYELVGKPYACEDGIGQDIRITALDFASVTSPLKERAEALLTARVETAEDVSQIYDEDNNYREDFVMDVLYDAAEQSLEQDAGVSTWDLTLHLVHSQGQWWVKPDRALIAAISGGTAG